MNGATQPSSPKQVVEQGYDQVAHDYARLEGETEWPRMRWLKKVLNQLSPGSSVLDLGCGSGAPADLEIAKEHRVTGVDISQTQISLARQNIPAGTFLHGDAGSIEFAASSFDAVVSFYTLEHIHGRSMRRSCGEFISGSDRAGCFSSVWNRAITKGFSESGWAYRCL